ncbi:hypothetical protein DSM104329_03204 [Capillimicrobium parvum]|uniref:Uncharacterized protein n=1 Tax=Capillimicrobium parvum TaxID=2884022 RepID=A0A9E7C1U8_9ACTN|nr:hypothetical protein DSM104329_03204 [Capillimicrobium parvum]
MTLERHLVDDAALEQLRADARHRRERADLYRAKEYGGRPTRPGRLRELEREAQRAEERLAHALSERARGR